MESFGQPAAKSNLHACIFHCVWLFLGEWLWVWEGTRGRKNKPCAEGPLSWKRTHPKKRKMWRRKNGQKQNHKRNGKKQKLREGPQSAFLKHAFREVTSGFCKGTVPGAPPRPSPGRLRMPKNNSKETYSVPPKGHLLVKNM